MGKTLYLIGIILAVIFFFVCGYYYVEAVKATDRMYASYMYGSSFLPTGPSREDVTTEIALLSLFFFTSFISIDIIGLINIKTKTMKVFGIIGLSLSGVFLFWNFAMMSSPGGMSFDEVGPAWLLYSLIMTMITIIGLVQSIRYANKLKSGQVPSLNEDTTDLLDS